MDVDALRLERVDDALPAPRTVPRAVHEHDLGLALRPCSLLRHIRVGALPQLVERRAQAIGDLPRVGDELAAGHDAEVELVHVADHGDVEPGTVVDGAHRVVRDHARSGGVQRERRPRHVRDGEVEDRSMTIGESIPSVGTGGATQRPPVPRTLPSPAASTRRSRSAGPSHSASPPRSRAVARLGRRSSSPMKRASTRSGCRRCRSGRRPAPTSAPSRPGLGRLAPLDHRGRTAASSRTSPSRRR